MHEMWHWILDFTGVNNGDDVFATHMYNFWSGFGGNVSILALIGTLIGIYHHNSKRFEKLNPMNIVHNTHLDTIVHKKDKTDSNEQ